MRIRTKSSIKGLRDIRTRSGKVGRAGIPYMAYMNISCLEMEKARREKEKFSAQTRIRNIDVRLAEIESDKQSLLVSLGERHPGRTRCEDGESVNESSLEKNLPDDKQAFRIRY